VIEIVTAKETYNFNSFLGQREALVKQLENIFHNYARSNLSLHDAIQKQDVEKLYVLLGDPERQFPLEVTLLPNFIEFSLTFHSSLMPLMIMDKFHCMLQ
jgi:hypothetical protein